MEFTMKSKQFKALTISSVLVLIMIVASTIIASATDKPKFKNKEKPAAMKELQSDMKNFFTSDIYPELKKWKTKLDGDLSKEDLSKLNSLRQKAVELKKEMKEKRSEFQTERKEGNKKPKSDMRDQMKDTRDNMQALGKEVAPLAEKYKSTIQSIGDLAKPKIEAWKAHGKEIFTSWKDKNKDELQAIKENNPKANFDMKNVPRMGFFDSTKDGNKQRMVVMFMLWDGELASFEQEFTAPINMQKDMGIEAASTIKNFPNPFSDKTTISFNLKRDDDVKLSITDRNGQELAVLQNGPLSAGDHTFTFDANDTKYKSLQSSTYFIRLDSKYLHETGKMVLKRQRFKNGVHLTDGLHFFIN